MLNPFSKLIFLFLFFLPTYLALPQYKSDELDEKLANNDINDAINNTMVEKRAARTLVELTSRNFVITHSAGPFESDNWWADYSTLRVYDQSTKQLLYYGKAERGCLMGVRCCSSDGHYCYTDYAHKGYLLAHFWSKTFTFYHGSAPHAVVDGGGSMGDAGDGKFYKYTWYHGGLTP